ncbi:TetR/AcrR family transcriptional regulator [Pseudoroseomonas globiformis]|uniref:TetR/AcrR family transcriptional regulator n=1 Tax=Teichococcus globiformis TaxID=2307229 RepID=A0ABV7G4G8_9PROT
MTDRSGGTEAAPKTGRKPRADAQRNRERVLEAARDIFSAGGAGASLEAVARQAGVGIGTLYRHFPTREALYEAVYRREVQQLVQLAVAWRDDPEPVAALRRWVAAFIGFVATKKGMSAALAVAAQSSSKVSLAVMDQIIQALDELLRRAAAAGEIRGDVGAEQMLRAMVGLCYAQDSPDWQDTVRHLSDIFIDGMARSASLPPASKAG